MGKFHTVNEQLEDYLVESGLTFHDREEPGIKYYTDHKTGNQVKLNYNNTLAYLLDNSGQLIDMSSAFTDNQIKKFLAN